MSLESVIQKKLCRFLDGPETFRLAALRRGRRYRSSTLALLAWTIGMFRLFLSPVALALLPVVILAVGYASIAMDAPMRAMLPVFLAVGVVELVSGFLFRPILEIQRRLPERVRAGSTFHVVYQIHNRRRRPAWDLRADPYPFAAGFQLEEPAALTELPGGAAAVLESRITAAGRGRYRVYRSRVESVFPFHLIKWACRGPRDAAELIVYPAFHPLTSVELPVGMRTRSTGVLNYSKVGESPELLGVRDYRDGDDMRRIDWPGSARMGNFVVKEFEEDQIRRVALITDTAVSRPGFWSLRRTRRHFPELEAALSLTAALAEYFSRGEAVVDIFAVGPEVYHLETGRHTGSFDSVCDILSGIEPSDHPVFEKLAPEVFRDLSDTGGAVVILLADDPERRSFLKRLQQSGVSLRVALITDRGAGEPPTGWTAVSPASILNGQLREL